MMAGSIVSCLRSEAWLLFKRPSTAFMVAFSIVVSAIAAASSSEVLIMVAGDDPYRLGGAIGFIGNLVDVRDVLGSAVRTSFMPTVAWVPATILYAVYMTSKDYGSVAYEVSKSRGVPEISIAVAKLSVNCALVGAIYLLSTFAFYSIKLVQWDIGISSCALDRFIPPALMIALVLVAMYAATSALYLITRNVVASSVVAVVVSLFVMVWYPSAYGSGWLNPLLMLSPVYYLMNLCSLSMQNVDVHQILVYGCLTFLVSIGVAVASSFIKAVVR